ncbi:hypothetical protein CPB85DRAFT_877149 [Mucidula mucida]|nr:hypothetical protein CPB85DRAFT_877149 [Mucidula mucida]
MRSQWKLETDNHVSYNKRLDQERNERIAADEERLERQRAADTKRHEAHLIEMDMEHEQGWQAEDKRRRTAWNVRDAQVFAREQAIRRKEDAMWRDEQHRKRSRLFWESLTPDHRCLSFESRKYTAELANIPTEPDVDALKWCMETEINIRGESYAHPRRCVREGGKIIAEWITHANEPTCRTYWDQHVKKECHGYHKRIVEAKLENHQQPWDNWEDMCYSTPSHFNFAHYDHPDICFETAHDGIFGRWFVADDECP